MAYRLGQLYLPHHLAHIFWSVLLRTGDSEVADTLTFACCLSLFRLTEIPHVMGAQSN
jgi:hypothetical protein